MKPKDRQVHFQHKWRFGHDPSDPDATPESGWTYIHWDVTEHPPTPPNDMKAVTGGPPSGIPCDRCREELRIVAKKTPKQILEREFDVSRLNEKVHEDEIFLLACPKCDRRVQFRGSLLRRLYYQKTGRLLAS